MQAFLESHGGARRPTPCATTSPILMRCTKADTLSSNLVPQLRDRQETNVVSTGQGRELFEHLTCPNEFRLFTKEEAAEDHCEGMALIRS